MDNFTVNHVLFTFNLPNPGGSVVKNLSANAGNTRDLGSIPGSGRSPGGRNGNPLQYSSLENSMDRGAWGLQSLGHTESDTESDMTQHPHTSKIF